MIGIFLFCIYYLLPDVVSIIVCHVQIGIYHDIYSTQSRDSFGIANSLILCCLLSFFGILRHCRCLTGAKGEFFVCADTLLRSFFQ